MKEVIGVDGNIIIKWMLNRWDGGMDWIDLAQDKRRRRALLKAEMKLWVP
jgi:hypothetical protein